MTDALEDHDGTVSIRGRAITNLRFPDDTEVHAKIQQAIGPYEDHLTIVKRRKLQWYGHVSRSSGIAKTIMQDTVKVGRRQADRGRGGKTTSGSSSSPRGQWRTGKKEEIRCEIICGARTTLALKE